VKQKRFKIVGHLNGYLKLVSTENLKVEKVFKVSLLDDEQLTVAAFSPSVMNFVMGTSLGAVLLCSIKIDGQGNLTFKSSRLNELTKTLEHGVTGIQISDFDPIGTITVAFDNGKILTWQSALKAEQFEKIMETQKFKKGKKRQVYDLSEIGGSV